MREFDDRGGDRDAIAPCARFVRVSRCGGTSGHVLQGAAQIRNAPVGRGSSTLGSSMSLRYADAVNRLHQAPLEEFVAERKRLALELTAGGDKEAGKRLAKLGRPTVSAWAVNQLWWRERDLFEKLLATGKRLAQGDLDVMREHREVVAGLRELATKIIGDAGHGTADAVLRRVTTTIHAIAAAGGFAPDPPGAIANDRDPPGFETMTTFARATNGDAAEERPATAPKHDADARSKKQRLAEEEARRRAEAARLAEEKARKAAERRRLEAALSTVQRDVGAHERELERLRNEVAERAAKLEEAREQAQQLEARLAKLE